MNRVPELRRVSHAGQETDPARHWAHRQVPVLFTRAMLPAWIRGIGQCGRSFNPHAGTGLRTIRKHGPRPDRPEEVSP